MKPGTTKEKAPNFKLHIFSLSCLAIAQPLLDVVAKNAEILVARQSTYFEIYFLLFVLSVIIPLLFIAPAQLTSLYSKPLAKKGFLLTVGLLVILLVLLALKNLWAGSGVMQVLVAIAIGTGLTLLYSRIEALRMFCDFLAPAIVLVPLLFVFNSEVSRAVANSSGLAFSSTGAEQEVPVVMVIFDELPVLSLLDSNADIDSVRYPNFSALASDSHWFRNARTKSGSTTVAVPAILSGSIWPEALPVAINYPTNLFTLLNASHQLEVTEQVTSLCPTSLCRPQQAQTTEEVQLQLEGLFTDLGIVYLHVLLPPDLTGALPIISQSWGNFIETGTPNNDLLDKGENHAVASSRYSEFQDFIGSIRASDPPGLYFHHTLLPHVPWEYLPSGKLYSIPNNNIPGLDFTTETWGDNAELVEQGYQRHLLQVGFVDKLLGDLIAKLKAEKIYDESLIVIVSDHGVNFWPGEFRRNLFDDEFDLDMLGITLMMKLPNQAVGEIHDEEISSLDILPTIASQLAIQHNGEFQGIDLFGSGLDANVAQENPYLGYSSLQRKLNLFGSGDLSAIYKLGKNLSLIDRANNEFSLDSADSLSYSIDQQSFLIDVNLNDVFIPSRLTGEITGKVGNYDSIDLAISLNNKIVAVTSSYRDRGQLRFSVMLPETEIVNGSNKIELFTISSDADGALSLSRLADPQGNRYRYRTTSSFESVSQDDDTNEYTIVAEGVNGYVDSIDLEDGLIKLNGWAANTEEGLPADFLLLDINGDLLYLGTPNTARGDVAAAFAMPAIESSGYQLGFQLSRIAGGEPLEVSVIAVSRNEATILNADFDLGARINDLVGM